MTKRAINYARVSYNDTATGGRNLDMGQLELGRQHCIKRGHTLIREVQEDDRGASGADADLPGILEIMEMARAGEFDVLVVREVDRLSRDTIKAAIVRRDLLKLGIEIEYVLYDFPPGPAGDMARQMMEVIAEYQRKDTILKTTRGRRNSVKAGNVIVAGRAPYGYRVVDKDETNPYRRLEPSEPEAGVVRMIFEWYAYGDGEGGPLTPGNITRRLMALGVPTPSQLDARKGPNRRKALHEWNASTVDRILKNETYVGRWQYGKVSYTKARCTDPACKRHRADTPKAQRFHYKLTNHTDNLLTVNVPPLIDTATWDTVAERRDLNRRNAWRPTSEEYLLRNKVKCAKCGSSCQCSSSKMRADGTRYRYYNCKAKAHPLTYARKCNQLGFKVEWVDAEVWGWIKELLENPEKMRKAIDEFEAEAERQAAPTRQRLATVEELLKENEAEYERLLDLYLGGHVDKSLLLERKTRLEERIAGLKTKQTKLVEDLQVHKHTSEQVRAALEFAEDQRGNVELATRSFEVRRGLMEDFLVEAELEYVNGEPKVHARSVFGRKEFSQPTTTTP